MNSDTRCHPWQLHDSKQRDSLVNTNQAMQQQFFLTRNNTTQHCYHHREQGLTTLFGEPINESTERGGFANQVASLVPLVRRVGAIETVAAAKA